MFDARAAVGLARLYLEQGMDALAQVSFDRAEKVLGNYAGWVGEELRLIQSRLEMRRGVYDKAFRRLRKGVLGSGSLDSTEAYVLLAIAAQATGNQKEMEEAVARGYFPGAVAEVAREVAEELVRRLQQWDGKSELAWDVRPAPERLAPGVEAFIQRHTLT